MNNIVKLIILGVLILAIPVSVKLVQEQQILKSRADSGECFESYYGGANGTCLWRHGIRDQSGTCQFIDEGVVSSYCKCADEYYWGANGTCLWRHGTLDQFSRCQFIDEGVVSSYCGQTGDTSGGQQPGTTTSGDSCPTLNCEYGENVDTSVCASGVQVVTGIENSSGGCSYVAGCSEVKCSDTSTPSTGVTPPAGGTSSDTTVYKCSDGTACKVSQNTSPPNCDGCAPLPNSSYYWKLIDPISGYPLDASKYGTGSGGKANQCGGVDGAAANAVCPKNLSDPFNVNPDTSNWCYEFTEGNRCIQLRHRSADGTDTGGGGGGGGTGDGSTLVCSALSYKSFPPSSICMAVLCSNAYKWVLIAPGTGGAPQVDASKYGTTNSLPNACAVKSDCPKNTSDSSNVNQDTSNWCYQFVDGTRCIQLQHIAGQTCASGGGGTCSIDGQTPDMGPTCAGCLVTKTSPTNVPQVITNIKNMNPTNFTACSNQQILNKWCNDFGAEAAQQCQTLKTGVCASACGGISGGGGSGGAVTPITTVPTCVSPASGSTVSPNNMTFRWGAVSGATVYDFRLWDLNSAGVWEKESIVVNDLTATSYSGSGGRFLKNDYGTNGTPINITSGKNYRYRVSARNSATITPLWADCNFATTASGSVSPPVPPPSVFTTHFRIAESPADFTETGPNGWQPYNAQPFNIDNFEFKVKTPGLKTIFVEFKDTNGKVGGCGLNQDQPCQKQIRLLGPDPAILGCRLSFEGMNTILNMKGVNFGSVLGTIKSGTTNLQVKGWQDGSIQAVWPNAPEGKILPVSLTNSDGQVAEGQCGSISALALGAKVFCRAPSNHQTDNVDLVLAEATSGGSVARQKVTIDKEGIILGLTQKLEAGKEYNLSLKAPRSLRRTVSFTSEEGITNLPKFILPIGDIFQPDGGDGKINTFDLFELVRQWSITKAVTGRSGDFNRDTRINSVDWTCMKNDFNCSDDPEAVAGPPMSFSHVCSGESPNPSPSASPGT